MSAREPTEEPRRRPLLTVLFWLGVGLAPIAALLLLVGQGNGPLRIAAVLAVLAVVLIGLSIALRGDAESVRLDLEETLLEELDDLRGELRNDIATAARATHKAFGEKLLAVQGEIEQLRSQLDPVRGRPSTTAAPAHGAAQPAGRADRVGRGADAERGDWAPPTDVDRVDAGRGRAEGAGRGGVYGRAPEPDHAMRSHGAGGPERDDYRDGYPDEEPTAAGPGRYARAGADHAGPANAAVSPGRGPVGHRGGGGPYGPGEPAWAPASAPPGMPAGVSAPPAAHLAGGVVRHTETVQVTTRQTIVGPHDDGPGGVYGASGNVYGGSGNVYGGSGNVYGAPGNVYGAGYPAGDRGYGGGPGAGPYAAGPSAGAAGGGGTYGSGGYGPGPGSGAGTYGAGPGGGPYGGDGRDDDLDGPPPPRGRRGAEPDDGGYGGQRSEAPRRGRQAEPEPELSTGDPADDAYWAELRGGTRWASVRSDDRGHEVRMGERRASLRTDDFGTELRMEDRWAAARREEPWPDGEPRGGRRGGQGRASWSERELPGRPDDPPALPAAGMAQSAAWAPPGYGAEPEPASWSRGHRADEEYGYPPVDESPRGRGARPGYGPGGDGWRG